jgi:phenylacetate-CoA ligase
MTTAAFVPEIERQSAKEIKAFQDGKLRELLPFLKEKSPFYSALFSKERIDITRIRSIDELVNIPVTSKTDLQQNNEEFRCVPP